MLHEHVIRETARYIALAKDMDLSGYREFVYNQIKNLIIKNDNEMKNLSKAVKAEDLISIGQCFTFYGLPASTINFWIKEGYIETFQIGENLFVVEPTLMNHVFNDDPMLDGMYIRCIEASKMLNVSVSTIANWIRKGAAKFKTENRWRYICISDAKKLATELHEWQERAIA